MSDINKENNERLEQFLKGAFEQFEATPSDAVWSRLQQNLQPTPGETPPAPAPASRTHWIWWAGAILAILLFIAQYAYFNHQFRQLKQDMEKQQQTIESMASMKNTGETPAAAVDQGEMANQFRSGVSSASGSADSGLSANPPAEPPASRPQISQGSSRPSDASAVTHKEPITSIQEISKPTLTVLSPVLSQSEPTVAYSDQLRPTKLTFQPVIIASAAMPDKLWSENANVPRLHLVPTSITSVHRDAQPITVGWRIATAAASTKVKEKRPPFNPFPMNHEDVFVQEKPAQGKVFMAGVTVQKPLSRGWSAVSGVDYTAITTEKTFNPSIRFEDRDRGHHGGPGGPGPGGPGGSGGPDHDFNYLIGTSTGTYLLGVELTERDSSQVISDDEMVGFEVKTKDKVKSIGIPVGLQYMWRKKNWGVFVQGGLRLNYIMSSKGNLESFTCNNNLFEIKYPAKITPPAAKTRQFVAEAYASAGIEYRRGRVGFQAGPTFYKPLQTLNDSHVQVQTQLAGVSAGMQYYF